MARPNRVSLAWRACRAAGVEPGDRPSGNAARAIRPVKAQAIVSTRLMKLP